MSQVELNGAVDGLRAAFTLRRGAFTLAADLSAPPGVTALLGPSGAGKSLTLQAIAGLVAIERGAIHLNGRALADVAARVALPPRLRRVGYVPQSYALFPHLSVGANIAYGLPERMTREAREKRVAELLRLVHLPGYEARTPHALSGGEAQRVALARALASRPDTLLLDEPFSALDTPTRAAIRDEVREIALASGLPTLLVTHNLSEALRLASRLALLVKGRVIAQGPGVEVMSQPASGVAARLLGWGALLELALVERIDRRVCLTLPCGQVLSLAEDDCAPDTLGRGAGGAGVRLALRAERLAVTRVDAAAGGATTPRVLRGVIRSVTESGALWRARVELDRATDWDTPLDLPFSAREWQSLGLTIGDAVTLGLTPGAARLVTADD